MLKGKKIILGVTGSIAAYKAVFLLRLLIKEGAFVQVIMTHAATTFVSPITFSTLSKNRVGVNLFENDNWENHALLGRWADLILIAPATANTIAKMANGICDNLLQAVFLSAACPVWVAPAMDEDMWNHSSLKRNLNILQADGVNILQVGEGDLASGLSGMGRMAEPEEIIAEVKEYFSDIFSLRGTNVLITSGPTIEPIDPVRFISNHSSGKMGAGLANAFIRSGADVTIITGPTHERINMKSKVIHVRSAEDMFEACMKEFDNARLIIMAAAVADFTPVSISTEKIKKSSGNKTIELKPTRDILLEAGKRKKANQLLVGFALETENEKANALEKLEKKNADYIILNSLKDEGAGFGKETNKVTIFGRDSSLTAFPLKRKEDLAMDIVTFLSKKL